MLLLTSRGLVYLQKLRILDWLVSGWKYYISIYGFTIGSLQDGHSEKRVITPMIFNFEVIKY